MKSGPDAFGQQVPERCGLPYAEHERERDDERAHQSTDRRAGDPDVEIAKLCELLSTADSNPA
jgi:hypothetical protein